MVCHQSRVYGH